jgi:hypothetical protein
MDELIRQAEIMGKNKDMFRYDAFVGLPWTAAPPLEEGKCTHSNNNDDCQERSDMVRIAASEQEIYPTTIFGDDELTEEAARLWIAGYEMGNYQTVPDDEVPEEFLSTGMLSSSSLLAAKGEEDGAL